MFDDVYYYSLETKARSSLRDMFFFRARHTGSPPRMDAAQQTLRLIRKGNPDESMTVGAYPFSIGRGRDSSYRIPDMKVSSKYETSRNMQNTDTCPPVLPSPLPVCFCA